ncbi:hypothetical protein EPA93_03300 [Ktedonosporobacter rubrisoli]|uniref:Uncharacterized protein n=1 Tax=Ktedonosporobacter rubrisoli TaxID=2509675 RepID=A0A4P6JJH0_KTERU|nr:hypothetical protein [Ktedonosporobacter rubrisoli]QBD75072.1 hypothetical protein EPA93_03300 [Ktedonosporobacter rubrisoli]
MDKLRFTLEGKAEKIWTIKGLTFTLFHIKVVFNKVRFLNAVRKGPEQYPEYEKAGQAARAQRGCKHSGIRVSFAFYLTSLNF